MGRQELKWHQLAHHQLMSQQGPHFSPHSKAKTKDKAKISGRTLSSGTSDVVTASLGENPSEEVLDYCNYYCNRKTIY